MKPKANNQPVSSAQIRNRRDFLTSIGMVGAASLMPAALIAGYDKENPQSPLTGLEILKTAPYLQAPTQESITIRWITHLPCHGWVEYGTTRGNLDQKAQTINNGLVQANNTVHYVDLTGLKPGQIYYYRVVIKEILEFEPYKVSFGETFVGDIYEFTTLSVDNQEVSFLVFNDIHDRPHSFKELMQFDGNTKRDFVLLNGDMFDYQIDQDQLVNHLLRPLGELFSSTTPFIFTCGNHETRGKYSRELPNYFNGNHGPKYYFSFQSGPAYFIVLDSGEDKEDEAPVYANLVDFDNYRLQQAAWLKKEIQKEAFKKAPYKIVFSHIPPYHSGDWHGTLHCREVWGPILNQAKIDLLISGHTHRYGIHQPQQGHNYPILIGGGPKEGERTLIQVSANSQSLSARIIDDKGQVVKTLDI